MDYPSQFDREALETSAGELAITFLGHGSLMLSFGGKVIHVDPYGKVADYSRLPKADLVLLTHEHGDHLDPQALAHIRKPTTELVMTQACGSQVKGGQVMRNGDTRIVLGLRIEAVPAYNIMHLRDNGQPFHPKGAGNGYVVTFGDKRVYLAGDTENIPEMRQLKDIDVAFLPMNLPYTMSPQMVADAARILRPAVLYPYHFGDTDTAKLLGLLRDEPAIEVRVRRMA
jgi:L-ascorbate metabolism protein UlaG (beta-lactamase superfamily)